MNVAQLPLVGPVVRRMLGDEWGAATFGRKATPPGLLAGLLQTSDLLLDVTVEDRDDLFELIGEHMKSVHGLEVASVVRGLGRRERMGSTAVGEGVAIPHARISELDRIELAYFRLSEAIPFDAPDDKLVTDIFVILVPKKAMEEHLMILAEVSRLFSNLRFREHLHRCATPEEVKDLFLKDVSQAP